MSSDSGMASPSEDKKLFDDKKYAIITKETIKLMADAAGHANLSDSAAALLGEDVSYRLREAAMNSCQFMRHAKRKRMTTEDFNKALRHTDVQPVFGHGSLEFPSFRQTRDGDLYFMEDTEVNLTNIACNTQIPKVTGETTIKAHWLAVEGVSKNNSQSLPGKINVKKELSADLLKYYEHITTAILGNDPEVMKTALSDLKTNPNIVPLLPYLVNFVFNGVKTVNHDLSQLTKLLYTVNSLVHNTSLFLEPQPYLSLLVQTVMYCILEPLAASINPRNDHWILRDYAARLQAQIVRRWSSPLNHLRYNTEKNLKETLYDLTKPLCSHYGAVMGLLSLGCKQVEEIIIPHLPTFLKHLNSTMEDLSLANAINRADAFKVYGALLLAAEFVLKRRNQDFEREYFNKDSSTDSAGVSGAAVASTSGTSHACKRTPCDLYSELYEHFGDSLTCRMPEPRQRHMFTPEKKEETVKLFDDGSKSGEQLLEEFMEQVRLQQQQDKERRVQEEKERVQREKVEKVRRELERIERAKREEEARQQQAILERQRLIEEEAQRKLMYEERKRQEEIRICEENIKREFNKRLAEEQQHVLFPEMRKRMPRKPPVVYPNEDEEDDDDFLMEENEADSEHSVSAGEGGSGLPAKWEVEGTAEKAEGLQFEEPPTLSVMSTISDPNQGIKLKIKRQPGLKMQIMRDRVASKEEPAIHPERHKDKESKHKRKRKQAQRSPKDHDPFDFDKSDPDYAPKLTFTPLQHVYSSPGGESSGSDGQFRKSKLTLKLKVPTKESMSE